MAALSNSAQFERIIGQLLDASGPEEARHILQDHPWLTSEAAHAKLTKMIARGREQRKLLDMTCLMSCRSLLHRCRRSEDVGQALAMHHGWPLRNQGPLNQLLALPGVAAADERIHWAKLARADVDPEQEPDFDGLIHYHLGWAHQIRVDEGSAEALAQAIAHYEAAEAAWRWKDSLFGRRFLGRAQDRLGRLYMQRRDGDRGQNVETALDWLHKAHGTFDETDTEQTDVLMLLGKAYLNRIQGERVYNVEQGIEWSERALYLAKERGTEGQMLGRIEHNLAIARRLRARDSDARNIEEAKELAERALKRFDRATSPEDWARTTLELATIYAHCQHGDRDENLETGIKYAKQALELYDPQEQPQQWTLAKLNLGNLYCDRVSGTRAENNRRAIRCFRDILRQCDKESYPLRWAEAMNNLGTVYASRRADWRGRNYRMAVECFTKALEVRQPESLPFLARQTAANLGDLHFGRGSWADARESLASAIRASNLLYQAAATPEARQAELREMRHLPARLAYALSKMPVEAGSDPLREAVLALEHNRARWLSETLALHAGRPPGVPQGAWKTFTACRTRIEELLTEARLPDDSPGKRQYLAISQDLTKAYAALEKAVSNVRKHDGMFMPSPSYEQVQKAVAGETDALVYFAVTPAGTVALVVLEETLQAVSCPLTIGALEKQVQTWFRAYDAHKRASSAYARAEQEINEQELSLKERIERLRARGEALQAARASWHGTIEATTGWIWKALMEPVVGVLSDHHVKRAAIIPQGWLGLLPLHAAWTQARKERRYALDEIAFTYAPNAQALAAAHTTAKRVPANGLFAVDEPEPVTGSPLPNSTCEIAAACAYFEKPRTLGGAAATRQAVEESLPDYPVLHFSCHGQAGFDRPLEGGLVLAHDKRLSLRHILSLRLEKARLAVLSACETGVPGTDLPDEVVSLPTGLAQAGVAGVIGSLWSVSDQSTMVLMVRFYELWRKEGLKPPHALRLAQRWIRDTSNGEKRAHFEQLLVEKQSTRKLPTFVVDTLYRRFVLADPEENDFEHPFHWAAFTYTGA